MILTKRKYLQTNLPHTLNFEDDADSDSEQIIMSTGYK